MVVDGAIDLVRVVGVHEGAGAIVDGLAGNGHVVGVHDAVDKAHPQPAGDEGRLADDHRPQQVRVGSITGPHLRIVAVNHVVGQVAERLGIATRLKVLEGAHPHMTARHPRQHRPGKATGVAKDRLAGGDRRQGAGGGDAQGRHVFADQVLTQHRSQPGPAVTPAGEGRAAGTLELDVQALAGRVPDLTQENGSPIAQLRHEAPELMAGIGHGQGHRPLRHPVAGENLHGLRRPQGRRVQSQAGGEGFVELDQSWLGHRHRRQAGEEALGQSGVAVVEGKGHGHLPGVRKLGRWGRRGLTERRAPTYRHPTIPWPAIGPTKNRNARV